MTKPLALISINNKKRMKNLVTILAFFLSINSFSQSSLPGSAVGKDFPGFELSTLSGEAISSEALKGKVLFINLWFTACVPCIEEMPELNKLKEKYEDKVEFYAITFDDAERVKRFLEKRDFNFDHIVGADSFLNNTLQNKSYPLNLIIDRDGVIQYVNGGIPFTKNKETGEMEILTDFFDAPLNEIIAN